MKSIFAVSFFVTLLFSAGTAFSYQCDIPAPPEIQPCTCYQCQKQKNQCDLHQPCSSRCAKCEKKCRKNKHCDKCALRKKTCKTKNVHKNRCQCKTTCTTKTENITTVQCRLCGTRYPKGVDHYCNKVQCRSCGQVYPRGVKHRCGMKQCSTCGTQYEKKKQHDCGKIRCQACGVRYHRQTGHHCKARCQHQNCPQATPSRTQGKQCSSQGVSLTQKDTRETRWHAWFKNKG